MRNCHDRDAQALDPDNFWNYTVPNTDSGRVPAFQLEVSIDHDAFLHDLSMKFRLSPFRWRNISIRLGNGGLK